MGTAWTDMDTVERYNLAVGVNATGKVLAFVTLYAAGRGRRFVVEPSTLRELVQTVDELEADTTRRLDDARWPGPKLAEQCWAEREHSASQHRASVETPAS